ncbi:DNA-directed RNA polymerase subunit beta [Lysinibacillus fusiformis]|nr:DNA-directed RNA polymerase subunit beta [Lysinibacillus fusiformis]
MTNELKSESTQPKVPQKEKKEKRSEKYKEEKPIRWYNFRLFPIWLRILIVLLLLVIAAASGLMIGFGVIGSGEPFDALKMDTWQHMLDIINGKE